MRKSASKICTVLHFCKSTHPSNLIIQIYRFGHAIMKQKLAGQVFKSKVGPIKYRFGLSELQFDAHYSEDQHTQLTCKFSGLSDAQSVTLIISRTLIQFHIARLSRILKIFRRLDAPSIFWETAQSADSTVSLILNSLSIFGVQCFEYTILYSVLNIHHYAIFWEAAHFTSGHLTIFWTLRCTSVISMQFVNIIMDITITEFSVESQNSNANKWGYYHRQRIIIGGGQITKFTWKSHPIKQSCSMHFSRCMVITISMMVKFLPIFLFQFSDLDQNWAKNMHLLFKTF